MSSSPGALHRFVFQGTLLNADLNLPFSPHLIGAILEAVLNFLVVIIIKKRKLNEEKDSALATAVN